jgi:hypothetical protein
MVIHKAIDKLVYCFVLTMPEAFAVYFMGKFCIHLCWISIHFLVFLFNFLMVTRLCHAGAVCLGYGAAAPKDPGFKDKAWAHNSK